MDSNSVLQLIVTFSQVTYMFCMLPQVVTNYYEKSANGLSTLFVIGYLNGFIAQNFYIFSLDLPIGYKIFCPVQFGILLVIVFQRLYFENFSDKRLAILCCANLLFAASMIPLLNSFKFQVGFWSGWAALILFSLSQVPQLFKVYTKKSVQGFSLLFIVVTGFGAILELTSGILLSLPLQTLFAALRNCLFVGGCLGAFYLYGNKDTIKKT